MAKKRTGNPWMPAPDYGRGLTGLSINLLVANVPASVSFAKSVLKAGIVYEDPDFAVLRHGDASWMLHADHTYENHPLSGIVGPLVGRGAGVEIRLHNTDPDAAEKRARDADYTVLAGASDKPHGLREVYIIDPDGYCWVMDAPTRDED